MTKQHSSLQRLSHALGERLAVYIGPQHEGTVPRFRVAVLSRYCYRERNESYPVKSSAELLKLLQLQNPPGCLFFIEPFVQNKRNVLIVELNAAFKPLLEQGVVVPETIVLAKALPQGLSLVETTAGDLYVSRFDKSAQGVSTAIKGGVLRNVDSAKLVFGYAADEPHTHWTQQEYQQVWQRYLLQLPWRYWVSCFRGRQSVAKKNRPWAAMMLAVSVVFLLYGLLSQAYISRMTEQRSAQVQVLSPDVIQRMNMRQRGEREIERIQALSTLALPPAEYVAGWDVVAILRAEGFDVENIQGSEGQLSIRGEVNSATAVLQLVTNHPQVQRAEFSAPVRRGRDGEVYAIRMFLDASSLSLNEHTQGDSDGEETL